MRDWGFVSHINELCELKNKYKISGSPIPHPGIRRTGSPDKLSDRDNASDSRMTGEELISHKSYISNFYVALLKLRIIDVFYYFS